MNPADLKRRDFLKILGGATVATALPACTPKKPQSLIPYVIPHEEIIPGKSVWYASVCRECPAGCGIHVRVRDGRAVKVEGNPLHPVNHGALCARGQASLHGLYNPDRLQQPLRKRSDGTWEQLSWETAQEYLLTELKSLRTSGKGSGAVWMTPLVTGTMDVLIDEFLGALGSRRRLRYEPIAYETLKEANNITFGRKQIPTYDLASAKALVSFGADFLETWISPVEFARQFTVLREFNGTAVSPFVYIGPRLSMTAANADEWIAPAPGTEHVFALSVLSVILSDGGARIPRAEANDLLRSLQGFDPPTAAGITGVPEDRIRSVAGILLDGSPSLVIGGGTSIGNAGELQTLIAVNLLNHALGNHGRTVDFDRPLALSELNTTADLASLSQSMERGDIPAFFFTETNPVFSTPPAMNFARALGKVPLTVAFSSFMDESTALASLVLPIHTAPESWGDYEPSPGIRGLMQPVMQPVFNTTRALSDIILRLTEDLRGEKRFSDTDQPSFEFLKTRWRSVQRQTGVRRDFDTWWTGVLANGGAFESTSVRSRNIRLARRSYSFSSQHSPTEFTLVIYPSSTLYDGRGANRPWLQELPDPMTQITWENWVEIHPGDAARLKIKRGDIVRLTTESGTIELPAYDYAGIRPGTVAVPMGQGHTEFGRYAKGNGANPISLLPASLSMSGSVLWSGTGVRLEKRDETVPLADVAGSDYLHGRNIVQIVTVEELLRQTKELEAGTYQPEKGFGKPDGPSLYPEHEHPDYRWGMTIDLDKCTGCSACVTACYAENNIPVVGKRQVELGRELSWLRVERYFDDPLKDSHAPYVLKAEFLPMLCQQCDNAPCEPVCPVYASYHTPEGLNAQVYNRCVGTRYCANNCPYKVRRFNWFDYEFPEPLNWQLNPDVTVRSKGVMEKCTFCVQRVVEAKNHAAMEGRKVKDGEITTACQQSCPSQAIVFGDLKDPESAVNTLREKNKPRGYRVLEELNTQPAVVYLKNIRS